ncbi:cell cycle checkpoint control protein family [Prunus dulcis]|uniref:Cell cycle checkpoint control protein family n=1 Tax=Prunus dulcis TaxID=3755 RepID=A0A4Y1RRU7_PRUDU|nr:cell cycle checkpoint control protein family [Prunus dulcis]
MEFSVSGNALKTFARSITCLARVGNELAIQASSSQAVCSVLRTPLASIDHLSIRLPDPDASKMQWTLECYSGMKKSYWIICNVEPDIQHLSLDRRRFPSSLVVRPRDLNRLLANFQSSLQEITIIATEPTSVPSDVASEIGGKAVELRSYIDPTKEFVQYTHTGDPIDVTFGVKELKAFLSFCEGCEVDIHLYFEKAGEPILMAPKFGLDDGSTSNFDATLVLATMLVSQLHESNTSEPPQAATAMHIQEDHGTGSEPGRERCGTNVSEHPSDHTRIWSDLSGSGAEAGQAQGERNLSANGQREIQRMSTMHISNPACVRENEPVQEDHVEEPRDRSQINGDGFSQRHPSNWIDADEDDSDEDGEENELCIPSTPPYYEEH